MKIFMVANKFLIILCLKFHEHSLISCGDIWEFLDVSPYTMSIENQEMRHCKMFGNADSNHII